MSQSLLKKIAQEHSVIVSSTQPKGNIGKVWIKIGKNLFNKNIALILNMYVDTSSNKFVDGYTATRSTYIEIEPNKTYTISKQAGKTFRVATCTDIPKHTGSILSTVADHTGTEITITTEANAKYLFINYYNTDNGDTAGEDVIKDSILIEQGSTATTYEDYIEKEIYVKNSDGVFERFYKEDIEKKGQLKSEIAGATIQDNQYTIKGNVCELKYEILPNQTIAKDSAVLIASGAPKPQNGAFKFTAFSDGAYRMQLNSLGELKAWYNSNTTATHITVHISYLV